MNQAVPAECDQEPLISSADHEPTFRDPAGELRLTASGALRQIRPAAVPEVQEFLASPLRIALEESGDLVSSRTAAPADHPLIAAGELWLEHPRIDPISYPWEWTPAQWRSAAECTLRVAQLAIQSGWTLKDATPLNIVFSGPKPVLVDVLSFERRDPHSVVWLAYGQFVRSFLLPMVAAKYLHWPLEATLFARDGYEPAQLYEALPVRRRFSPYLLDVVTLAVLLEKRGAKQGEAKKHAATDPELAVHILLKRLARLRRQIQHAAQGGRRSRWSEYRQTAAHYRTTDHIEKQEFVKNMLQRCGPRHALDLGANTGTYSLMAADAGAEVVALDSDSAALDVLWRKASEESKPITTIVANIARPTPAAGWRNREQLSLLDRLTGRFDLVLMLAVIHHLILREQLPLRHIGELCASLTRRWLLLEWVPATDPMYQEWLRGREDLYGHLTESDLLDAFAPDFRVTDRCEIGNGRVLLLFERL
jgi:SAM-dependent methyltransferase